MKFEFKLKKKYYSLHDDLFSNSNPQQYIIFLIIKKSEYQFLSDMEEKNWLAPKLHLCIHVSTPLTLTNNSPLSIPKERGGRRKNNGVILTVAFPQCHFTAQPRLYLSLLSSFLYQVLHFLSFLYLFYVLNPNSNKPHKEIFIISTWIQALYP